jgi:hypothetical protein
VVVGLGLWEHMLFAVPAACAALVLLTRLREIGVRSTLRGVALAACGFLGGFAPWLVFNLSNHFLSLRSVPLNPIGRRDAIIRFYDTALPVFMGTKDVIAPALTSMLVGGLAVLAARHRRTLIPRATMWHHRLHPLDGALLLLPVMLILVTMTRFNGVYADARYFMPAVVPMVVLAALAVLSRPRSVGIAGVTIVAVFVVASAVTTARNAASRPVVVTIGGAIAVQDWTGDAAWLTEEGPTAVYADYWVIRPLEYITHDAIPMAPYNANPGLPDAAEAAASARNPDYLFLAGDRNEPRFIAACQARGITYTVIQHGDRHLYHRLSAPLPLNVLN